MTDQQFTGHTTYGTLGGIITIIAVNINAGDLLRTTVLAAVGAVVSLSILPHLQLLGAEVAQIKSLLFGLSQVYSVAAFFWIKN